MHNHLPTWVFPSLTNMNIHFLLFFSAVIFEFLWTNATDKQLSCYIPYFCAWIYQSLLGSVDSITTDSCFSSK